MGVHVAGELLHVVGSTTTSTPLLVAVFLAGVGSAALLALGVAAFVRRRSLSYLLVALAIATLGVRAVVAGLTIGGVVAVDVHHVAEHVLDVATVGLVLGAVYYAREVERGVDAAARGETTDVKTPDGGDDGARSRVRTDSSRSDDA